MNYAVNFANITYLTLSENGNLTIQMVDGKSLTAKAEKFAILTTSGEGLIKWGRVGIYPDRNLEAIKEAIKEISG